MRIAPQFASIDRDDDAALPARIAETVYPPADPGLPACDPDGLLDAVQPTIARLRELTVSDRDNFETAYLAPIRELARLVHLLPA
ncbi:MAG: hypothetical protein V4623_09250, partial [Pseudomonadota bacterium]